MNRLNTGDTGQAVAASSDGLLYSGFMGDGYYVLSSGSKFDAEVQSNNSIRIADGSALMQGRHVEIPASDSEYVTINNGSQGMNRKDLIVFRYTKAVTGAEEVNVVVIEGEETSGTAEVPEYTEGDILSGATQADMPLYIVELQGINIIGVTPQFTIVNTHKDVMDKIGNTAMGTSATTLTGAVSELNSKLSVESASSSDVIAASGVSKQYMAVYKIGRILFINAMFHITSAKSNNNVLFTFPSGFKPGYGYSFSTRGGYIISTNETGDMVAGGTGLPVGDWYTVSLIAITISS